MHHMLNEGVSQCHSVLEWVLHIIVSLLLKTQQCKLLTTPTLPYQVADSVDEVQQQDLG